MLGKLLIFFWILTLVSCNSETEGANKGNTIKKPNQTNTITPTERIASDDYADELRRWLEDWLKNNRGKLPVTDTMKAGNSFKDCLECPEMVVIPEGTFQIGSEKNSLNERPVHFVIVKSFAIGRYEVTFDEYDAFAKATGRDLPSDNGWGRDRRPVINVSWNDATAYAQWLSQKTGKPYRLPTEAEWEYAARAGTQTEYYFGDDDSQLGNYAWYWDNSDKQTHPIGGKKLNAFGLYDMAGNVWEWTCSAYTDKYDGNELVCAIGGERRVLRGGSWSVSSFNCRPAFRDWYNAGVKNFNFGFRLVSSIALR